MRLEFSFGDLLLKPFKVFSIKCDQFVFHIYHDCPPVFPMRVGELILAPPRILSTSIHTNFGINL